MSAPILPPGGLLEIPGLKGTIQIHYDLARGDVQLQTGAHPIPFGQLVQLLLVAAQGVVNQWQQAEAGIIRPKGNPTDGTQEKSDP